MTDYFALLEEVRRPWLEPDALKQKFLAGSARRHPDKINASGAAERAATASQFAEWNAAYTCLAEPKSRLRHLLELELGAKPKDIQSIPAALADLFAEVAMACRAADAFLAEKSSVSSPLLQVRLFERGQDHVAQLQQLQQKLNQVHARLLEELKGLDEQWTAAGAGARGELLPRLEELYRRFSYFNRWHKQVQDRVVPLSF